MIKRPASPAHGLLTQEGLSRMLAIAAVSGAARALGQSDLPSRAITKAEAYRRYGRSNVDRWMQEGLLAPKGTVGGRERKLLDEQRLEAVASASNRITYLPVADRGMGK